MQVTIWHNPKCSKSRETLKLLEDNGINPIIRLYLKDAPSAKELLGTLERLGMSAHELVRPKEPLLKVLGLDNAGTSEDMLIAAMVEHPRLIERPVVMSAKGAVLGRPPENVLEII